MPAWVSHALILSSERFSLRFRRQYGLRKFFKNFSHFPFVFPETKNQNPM